MSVLTILPQPAFGVVPGRAKQAVSESEGSLPAHRADYAARICAAWKRSREQILTLGKLLIEARRALPEAEFSALLAHDMPFSPWTARQLIRIAAEIQTRWTSNVDSLPESATALDELRILNDLQFEHAIATGEIHERLTVAEARALKRRYQAPHRPAAVAVYSAPTVPKKAAGARCWEEAVYLLVKRRKALGLSQIGVDAKIGWADGQTSKYEIPHREDGRVPGWKQFFEWCQALDVGLALVEL